MRLNNLTSVIALLLKGRKERRISSICRYVLIFIASIIFVGFFISSSISDYDYSSSFGIDIILYLLYIFILCCVFLVIWNIIHSVRYRKNKSDITNRIPSGRIALFVALALVAILLLTFAFGSSQPVGADDADYASVFWLKASDMFISTISILLIIAILLLCVSGLGIMRSRK